MQAFALIDHLHSLLAPIYSGLTHLDIALSINSDQGITPVKIRRQLKSIARDYFLMFPDQPFVIYYSRKGS
eukprot:m.218575 g.218575  ORF g.218575 m.218575 type:complete len:71 (+) comp13816_c1_seq14:4069-4281(+)